MFLTKEQKEEMLHWPLEQKVQRTKELILEWYLQYKGKVYVSFSGGKDSTVLLHIARSIKGLENIVGVFSDTGLEYPEIREFVKTWDNIIWIKPKLTFKQVIEEYGYPIISKDMSKAIYDIRNTKSEKLRQYRLTGVSSTGKTFHNGVLSKRYYPLINADFKISNRCCDKMKKQPFHKFEKDTGMKAIIGMMADESSNRMHLYMSGNCNAFRDKRPVSRPLMFWTEQDIYEYIDKYKLPIASVYGKVVKEGDLYKTTGVHRTGCMFCMYGVHLEGHPNRFERMKETHPYQYDYIMNKLNGKHVLDCYLGCLKRKRLKIKKAVS